MTTASSDHGSLQLFPASVEAWIARTIFYLSEQPCLFDWRLKARNLKSLREYGLEHFHVEHVTSHDNNETDIGLWFHPPKDATKPVYVVFHGRTGHWGSGQISPDDGTNRDGYRIAWLKAIAATGAGVVAVHTRGCGLSIPKLFPHTVAPITEKNLRADMAAVNDFLIDKKITPDRCIVAGESLGGALATMMAEAMPAPPAVLGLINTFSSMAQTVQYHMAGTNISRYVGLRIDRLRWHPGRHVSAGQLDNMLKRSDRRFHNVEHLRGMKRAPMECYIAYTPEDEMIPARDNHHIDLAKAAQSSHVTLRELSTEDRTNDPCQHINWNPHRITADLEKLFERTRQVARAHTK